MKINRHVFIAAVLTGVLALAGCGKSSGSGDAGSASAEKQESAQEQTAEQPAEQAEQSAAEEAPAEEKAPETDYPVTIDGVRLAKDYQDKDCVIVTCTFTNNSEDTKSFASALHVEVFQNGIQCDTAITMGEKENDNYLTDVRPGTTISVDMAYELQDLSDIEVEVKELFSFKNEILASGTYPLQ